MAQYVAPRPDIQIAGVLFRTIAAPLGAHVAIATRALSTIGAPEIDDERLYPIQLAFDVLKSVARSSGDHTLLAIGKSIAERAVWPALPPALEEALATVDVAYHMNHWIDGEVMFDPQTGVMREGIGHYRCEVHGKREVVMVCDTPYPSELDRGILLGTARRAAPRAIKPHVNVELDTSRPSRKHGAASCTYRITW